jgi:hypothetical protein
VATIEATAARLAELLVGGGSELADPSGSDLIFEDNPTLRLLERGTPPPQAWAVDGGQALVADARCLQLYVTRAASVCWSAGCSVREDEGVLEHHLLGCGEERAALVASGAPVAANSPVDINLLRDWGEWQAVRRVLEEAELGALVLVDGDLQPDWRIGSRWLGDLLGEAAARGVTLVGVTKHSSLSRGATPLLGHLEREAGERLGPRAMWWTQVASTRPDVGEGLRVLMARLDPDARFAFRVDLPLAAPVEATLGALSALCDDAAFPGYPYSLSVADRLAACPGWLRTEVWELLDAAFDAAGIDPEVRERAFADRHRLMERG